MYLLATVTARDLGWIGTLEMVERLEATLATIERLEPAPRAPLQLVRHARPRPLDPIYVSSVDSGNLAGHLLTLAERVPRDARAAAARRGRPRPGIDDAVPLTRQAAAAIGDDRRTQTLTRRRSRRKRSTPLEPRRRRRRRTTPGTPGPPV